MFSSGGIWCNMMSITTAWGKRTKTTVFSCFLVSPCAFFFYNGFVNGVSWIGVESMRLIDITNSYSHLVAQQLSATDAQFVKVYSLGPTTVVYTQAPAHQEILLTNERRNILDAEIDYVLDKLCKAKQNEVDLVRGHHLAEVSIPMDMRRTEIS